MWDCRLRLVLLNLAAIVIFSGIFVPAAMASPVDAKITVAQAFDLQKKFEAAQSAGDAKAMAALIADDATFVHWNMRAQTKGEFIAAVGEGQSIEGPDRKVVLLNDGTGALVIGPVTITIDEPLPISINGNSNVTGKRQMHLYLSTLWVRTAAGWQVLFSQAT